MALLVLLMVAILAFVVAMFFSLDKPRGTMTSNSISAPPVSSSNQIPPMQQDTVFPQALGIDRQYQNTHVNMTDRHPVLQYQFSHDKGIVPATPGDPIRIPDVAGPMSLYGDRSPIYDSMVIRPQARPYGMTAPGPYPGMPIGVPVPAGTLKATAFGPADYGSLTGVGGYFPYQPRPLPSGDYFPAVGSVDAYAPFPGVNTPWEKAGILTSTHHKNEILNLFRRPIAPGQNLWEYQVQDKNGFIIKLEQTRYLEDGDEIHHVIGKHGLGPWKAHIFVQNRYVWV
jgi:hypothetical protein